MNTLKDRFARQINYLRISVTDRCNLRCVYCMPPEGIPSLRHEDVLSFEEIHQVAQAGARLGLTRLRLTGGEPLVRRGVVALVRMLAGIQNVRELAMTTNGCLLAEHARPLRDAGLNSVNVSLDTLREDRFREITRCTGLDRVLAGIRAAEDAGFDRVKINVVVMRGLNDDEAQDFARMSLDRDLEVRFIELMAIGHRGLADRDCFVPNSEVLENVRAVGELIPLEAPADAGPSSRYRFAGAPGRIGFISPVSEPFCAHCNRLRLTADGMLRSCLLEGGERSVRDVLRSGRPDIDQRISELFQEVVALKPLRHRGCGQLVMRRVGG